MIQRLPYDILWHLNEILDRKSLLSIVLVNHAMSDIASRHLYSKLVTRFAFSNRSLTPEQLIPLGNSFRVFERKPELRSAVRSVEILADSRRVALNPFLNKGGNSITMSECCREFSLFINLRILSVGYFYIPYKCRDLDAIIDAVSTLRHLQLLKYGTEPPPDDFPTLQHIKEFEITSEDFSTLNNYSFKNRIVKLATPFQCFTPVDLPLIEGLPNLKELSLGEFQASLEELCIALEAAPKLTHLKFYFYVRHIPLDDYRPTNLTRLSHLTIVLQRGHPLIDDDTLYWLVESIAGRSSLSSLGIMWHNLKPAKTRCEKLLQHLFARHGPTLRKLKLPFFHMTKTIFHRLGRRMPCLTQLWIGATPQMKTWLSDVICAFLKLERLRLYNLDECEFPFSVSCLQQACPALKVIKVCQRSHYKIAQDTPFVRYAWKSTWVYEPPIGSSKRIEGPLKSHRLRWSVGKYYINQKGGYASDSGSDMDFG